MAIVFFMLLLSWRSLRTNRPVSGGILLGAAISLKLVGWPVVLFLALKKNWRAVSASIATVLAANAAAAAIIGYEAVFYYYVKVASLVSWVYRGHAFNFSLWGLGWKLFWETGSPVLDGPTAPPLFRAEVLAGAASVMLPLLVLILSLNLSRKVADFDAAFAIMLCVSILINPIAWSHYLILALLSICVIVRKLLRENLPKTETHVALSLGLLISVSHRRWHNLAIALGGQGTVGNNMLVNPWILAIQAVLPGCLVLTLIWLLYRLSRSNRSFTDYFIKA